MGWGFGRRVCGIMARSRGWKFRPMISRWCWLSGKRSSSRLRKIGYTFVALDLVGYRMGSLNQLLKVTHE